MKTLVSVVVAGLMLSAAGCSSPAEKYCKQMDKCNALEAGETTEQCIEEIDTMFDELGKIDGCSSVSSGLEDVLVCASKLSCDELTDDDEDAEYCSGEQAKLMAALLVAPEACSEAMGCASTGSAGLPAATLFGLLLLGLVSLRRRT